MISRNKLDVLNAAKQQVNRIGYATYDTLKRISAAIGRTLESWTFDAVSPND